MALDRRDFLFADADGNVDRAVAMYGLIATAKLNGRNCETWRCHVLTYITDYSVNRVNDFLLRNCAAKLVGRTPFPKV